MNKHHPIARGGTPPAIVENRATALMRMRNTRNAVFGGMDLFGEPGWEVLLALKAAQGSSSDLMTKNVADLAGFPQTTVQRWLVRLEEEGLVRRETGSLDQRRVCVSLTDQGSALMDRAVEAMFAVDR